MLVVPRYRTSVEEVPVGEYTLPLGQAAVVREGADITLVGWGAQVRGCGAHRPDLDACSSLATADTGGSKSKPSSLCVLCSPRFMC